MLIGFLKLCYYITIADLIGECAENIKINEIIFRFFLKNKYGRGAG